MNLGVLLGYARIPGTPLKLPGKLSCCRPSLPHCGHTQTQVEFITLQLVPDVFDYLPPGCIAAIHPSSPINLHCPQCTARLQPRIYVRAHRYTSHSADGRWSQIFGHGMGVGRHPIFSRQEPSLERSIGGPLLQAGHHLCRTFNHCSLNGGSQFPPTIGQPKGLAAHNW